MRQRKGIDLLPATTPGLTKRQKYISKRRNTSTFRDLRKIWQRYNVLGTLAAFGMVTGVFGIILALIWIFNPCWYLCSDRVWPQPPPLPDRSHKERQEFVDRELRKLQYYPQPIPYDIYNCPDLPPKNYPLEFPIMDVLHNWNITDTEPRSRTIYNSLCVFDYANTPHSTIYRYREAEVPFVIRNDPGALETAERWNTDDYLFYKLQHKVFHGEFSKTHSMMYWSWSLHTRASWSWRPPTRIGPLTFEKWYDMAVSNAAGYSKYSENAYLRVDGCLEENKKCDSSHRRNWQFSDVDFLFDDLSFFHPQNARSELYLVEKDKQRGIQCRFGARGLVAEDHFDSERNVIAVLGGERRYILGKPTNCPSMSLYPQRHPMERHSKVDWNNPDLEEFPDFSKTQVNEVVLQAGDILYLPTYWFHHIVSLSLNYQCNTRSGHTLEFDQDIYDCGFFYDFPS